MIYELRIYTAHSGKLPALISRFRDHTTALFEKHGLKNVGYWTNTVGGRSDELGRPYLYATTRRFLRTFGLRSLNDLPRAESLRAPAGAGRETVRSAAEPPGDETNPSGDVELPGEASSADAGAEEE